MNDQMSAHRNELAYRKLFGILVPNFNSVVEPELARLCPDGVTNQTARFSLDENVQTEIVEIATKLLPCFPAAFVVGIAIDPFPGGLELLEQTAHEIQAATGRPVFTASHANYAALDTLGVKRIALVTPFDDAGNEQVREVYEAQGFEVVSSVGASVASVETIASTTSEEVMALFAEAENEDVEAFAQVGTGLPVVHLIESIESNYDKPVVASNAAVFWQALRESGIEDAIEGAGRLLRDY